MRRATYAPRPFIHRDGQPFGSAEEAWLWYAQCQVARLEGVRFVAGAGDVSRPCEPDDIYRAVDRLYRRRVLCRRHLLALGRCVRRPGAFGAEGDVTPGEAALLDEALDRLTTVLRHKGIVA